MTNAPETRKTHVIRILGTNKAGEVLQDVWADVERIDIVKYRTQTVDGWNQAAQDKLRWMDDPAGNDYNPDGNPARKTEIVKVCDVETEENVDDPEEWIPIPVIKSARSRLAGGSTGVSVTDYTGYVARWANASTNDARVVEARRIYHYDTNIDDDAQAAFDQDPELKAYVVPGDQYIRDDSTKDDTQYVEHEIIKYLKVSGDQGVVSERRGQVKLLNQYLIDESVAATLEITGLNGTNPPYRLDPWQNIVNINFGGLAVEYSNPANGKSYITLPQGIPDFQKAVISFWVRVPQATIDLANAEYYDNIDTNEDLDLFACIPFITFGPNPSATYYHVVHEGTDFHWEERFTCKTSPSFIGIRCGALSSGSETGDQNVHVLQARMQYDKGGPPAPSGEFDLPIQGPDYFQVGGYMDGSVVVGGSGIRLGGSKPINVQPDHWHHVLVSFDLSSPTTSSFWWAFDDVNYNGDYLWPNQTATNSICTNYTQAASTASGPIPTSGKPISIPADNSHAREKRYNIEMAEMQIWTGVTLDTGNEDNRRAFINRDGKPELDYSIADQLLGKAPDIRLHGARGLKRGRNAGIVTGGDPVEELGSNFDFTPVGDIQIYKPDPSLNGPQSPKK